MSKLPFIAFTALAILGLSFTPLQTADNEWKISYIAFQPGEKLKFTIHFGAIHAGEATLQIKKEAQNIAGKDHYHVQISGHSYPVFDMFYKVRDVYETYIDKETLLPTLFYREVNEGTYNKKEYYIFNRKENKVKSGSKMFDVRPGIHDVVSTFYYFRCLDYSKIKPGTFVPVTTFFDEEEFPLGVTYIGKKVIKTKFGKVRCRVFTPRLIKGRIFVDQSDMTLYVSDDANQIPVRIESKVFLGYVKADLIEYSGLKYPFPVGK